MFRCPTVRAHVQSLLEENPQDPRVRIPSADQTGTPPSPPGSRLETTRDDVDLRRITVPGQPLLEIPRGWTVPSTLGVENVTLEGYAKRSIGQ